MGQYTQMVEDGFVKGDGGIKKILHPFFYFNVRYFNVRYLNVCDALMKTNHAEYSATYQAVSNLRKV